jgi:hypothetical protein
VAIDRTTDQTQTLPHDANAVARQRLQGAADDARRASAPTTASRETASATAEPLYFDTASLYHSDSDQRSARAATDRSPEQSRTTSGDQNLDQSREKLEAAARAHFKDPKDFADFERNRQELETRMGHGAGAEAETAKTYDQIRKLLDTKSSQVDDKERVAIAGQVMDRAAHPTASNQGSSYNCEAATVANRIYSKNPSEAARAVTEATLTGSYHDGQGRTIHLDHDTVAHNRGQLSDDAKRLGAEPRTHADQIMQALVRNEDLVAGTADRSNSQRRYEVHAPDKNHPTGEFTYDYSTHPPTDISASHTGTRSDEGTLFQAMTGKEDFNSTIHRGDGSTQTLDDFKRRLANQHDFPVTMSVNPDQEPFKSMMGTQGGEGIQHDITIEGYDPKTGQVRYRNAAFGSKEQSASADQLYNSMFKHRSEAEVGQVAAGVRENPQSVDPQKLQEFLAESEPKQRQQVLRDLSRESGVDLSSKLTAEQKRDLGLAGGVFERWF